MVKIIVGALGRDRGEGLRVRLTVSGMVLAVAGLMGVAPVCAQSTPPLAVQPNSGRVGIGTASPADNLHLKLPAGTAGGVTVGDGDTPVARLQDADATGSNGLLQLYSGGTEAVRLQAGSGSASWINAGNVGIGTTVPGTRLQVADSQHQTGFQNVAPGTLHIKSGLYSDSYGNGQWTALSFGGAASTVMAKIGALQTSGGSYMYIGTSNNYNAGVTNYAMWLDPSGNLNANTLYASAKYFKIDHPVPGLKETRFLVHGSLEGPELGVYYRGEARLRNGEAVVELPRYFEALTSREGRSVQLTPIGGWSALYVVDGVDRGRFTVRAGPGGSVDQRFYWEVKAVRGDVSALEVEPVKGPEDLPDRRR